MISESYIKDLLLSMGYIKKNHIYEKFFPSVDCYIKVDLKNRTIIYPEDRGMTISNRTTCNFSAPENFVVLECVTRLFDKGYRPEHLNLEKEWTLGHESKGGRADICVSDQEGNTLFIVECKTYGREYEKEYKNIVNDGGQLFSYWQQERSCKFLVLYASKYEGKQIKWDTESIDCSDDANIVALSQKDDSIKLFKNAHTVSELYSVWDETYEKRFSGDVIFRDDSSAYQIGVKPLRKADLKDFADNNKIVNKFEEILRHNNVSDKENAFNRLVALFICKLVDEIQKDMEEIVDFQYKVGTDTYESLQDRLQRLHKEGMEKFMKEEIFYVPDDYAENLVRQYTGQERKNMIAHLKHTLRILKFYTNNDFAFKDVHNEQLFLQNGKILVEVVQLFEKFRIIGSENLQMLGDLFEQLLSKGFKQNEGQFFTPVPITRFIWNSLPVEKILKTEEGAGLPKIIDYACGAGHFLTEGFEAVSACVKANDGLRELDRSFAENNIFGIEKDYRLARVSKISLFMHGAGEGNIIFGDGLENYPDKNIKPNTFDILVANPPYSVSAFKPHLKLKNNSFSILDTISNNGSEIETLFVERISQLLKPNAVAAVILPSSILNKENESFICARESILKNFKITLDGTKEDYEKLRKQYPHLSIEECEYSCAGAEFYMKLLKHQGFMIHASAVEKEGKAYLFSAPSGTGKSTHAQLWRQTFKGEPIRIINDDKPAVCLQNGVFYACGTPFSGKTDKNENRKAPIQGLCMLHRGKTNKIQKITSGEALPLILPQTLFYGDEEETNLLLSFLDRFLQSVPVYKMECTMEEEAAKTAYFCMKGEEK